MTDKTKYWLRNPADGTFAVAEGGEERDRLIPLGHELADEPSDDAAFVWMRHDGIERPARLPYGAREHNLAREWTFAAPPDPVDLTKDPLLVDPVPAAAEPAAKSSATAKPATAADKNEGASRG